MDNTSREEADELLRKRKRRSDRACYPCAKRKVRCEGGQPCTACTRRRHPEICHFASTESSPRQTRPRTSFPPLPVTQSPSAVPPSPYPLPPIRDSPPLPYHAQSPESDRYRHSFPPPPPPHASHPAHPPQHSSSAYSEHHRSAPPPLRPDYENASAPLRRHGNVLPSIQLDFRSGPGLEATIASYPLTEPKSPTHTAAELDAIAPSQRDCHNYFRLYHENAYPYYPIAGNIDELESFMCDYLPYANAVSHLKAESELRDPARIGLLLACLASGVQFSNIDTRERVILSRDFLYRAFQCLRLSNFIFRPTLQAVQAMLIMGHNLQTFGQSDAAWAILGTTIRLGQILGLHDEKQNSRVTPQLGAERKKIWESILWQDSMLSLRSDRPPSLTALDAIVHDHEKNLTYSQAMFRLSAGCVNMLHSSSQDRNSADAIKRQVESVDSLNERLAPHLRDKSECANKQQRCEFWMWTTHKSYLLAEVCRPACGKRRDSSAEWQWLRGKAIECLFSTVEGFLELQCLSYVPMRSWSLMHEALSSALVLGLLDDGKNDSATRHLQHRLIKVFEENQQDSVPIGAMGSFEFPADATRTKVIHVVRRMADMGSDFAKRPRPPPVSNGSDARLSIESLSNSDREARSNGDRWSPGAMAIPTADELSSWSFLDPSLTSSELFKDGSLYGSPRY